MTPWLKSPRISVSGSMVLLAQSKQAGSGNVSYSDARMRTRSWRLPGLCSKNLTPFSGKLCSSRSETACFAMSNEPRISEQEREYGPL